MAPSLPIPAKLATAILEALNAVVNGHMPTVGDRRRAATAFIQLTLELDRFERKEPELSDALYEAMDEAQTPGGFDHPPPFPLELSPTRRGRPALTKPSCARPRKAQHAQEPRPPSADRHRIPRKNCCPCCGRRIPRNRRGRPLTAGTAPEAATPEGGPALRAGKSSAAPPDNSTSSPTANVHACACQRPTRAPAAASTTTAPTPRTPSPTRAAVPSSPASPITTATATRAAPHTPPRPAPASSKASTSQPATTTKPTTEPTRPSDPISEIVFRHHPTITNLLTHIHKLRAPGRIYCFSAIWATKIKHLNIRPSPKPP